MKQKKPLALLLSATLLAACHDTPEPTAVLYPALAVEPTSAPAPAPLVPITAGGTTQQIWPFTGQTLAGAPQDPINLIFAGEADPRSIRAALLSLSGDRTGVGFPATFPFDCTWKDAIGGLQTTYSETDRWEGSVIQLECGEYDPVRFHIRLFRAGPWTLANAHLDVLIPGTADHQVLTWELAEQLVTADFIRSGLLAAPPAQSGPINPAPFREIPPVIYNGLPPGLRALTGGPQANVTTPVPLQTNGSATILVLGDHVPLTPGTTTQSLVLQFNQVIPKPFCNPQNNIWMLVEGPLQLRHEVRVLRGGGLISQTSARGQLWATVVDPITRTPLVPRQRVRVREDYATGINNDDAAIRVGREYLHGPRPATAERMTFELEVGPNDHTRFQFNQSCWH
ncbi:hypothetical protein BH24GEM3_BH24GEM3_26820 [soil metagenome]